MTSWGGMVRRSNPEKQVRKEDELPNYPKPKARTDIEIIEEQEGLLSKQQLDLLQNCASLNFSLEEYKSIAAILNSLNVPVYIRNGIIESSHNDFFYEMKNKWGSNLKIDLPEILELSGNSSSWLRGRYLRDKKIIELFPEEMKAEATYPGGKVDDTMVMNLLISTLAHETMHAYFDRPEREMFPYAYFVEEPLAEFGMLVYMNETEMPDDVIYWAYEDVKKKHSCYRFGADLYSLHNAGDTTIREYLEKYKIIGVGKYDVLDVDGAHNTWRILHCPVPGCPAISSGTVIRAGIFGTMISSKRFYFEAKSCWCKPGPRLFFTIKKYIYLDPLFAANYKRGDKIRISFYDKKGVLQFAGYATIISQNRLSIPAEVAKEYARIFGINDNRLFGFYEATPASGSTTPAEWIAKEI